MEIDLIQIVEKILVIMVKSPAGTIAWLSLGVALFAIQKLYLIAKTLADRKTQNESISMGALKDLVFSLLSLRETVMQVAEERREEK